MALLVLLGLALLAVESFVDPLGFNNHDEYGHLRETFGIIGSRHLLSYNPIQAEYTYFPGIELATSTFAHFSGLSIFTSWKVLAAALRVMELLALFLIIERAIGSARGAGLGVLIYMCNPSFMYFDAHFAYESFALPFGFLIIQRAAAVEDNRRQLGAWVLFLVLLVPLVVSHHLAAYLTAAILVLLACAEQLWGNRATPFLRARRTTVGLFAAAAAIAAAAWTVFVAPSTISSYLGPVVSEAVSSTVGLATGARAAEKTLFEAQNKQASPLLEEIVGFAAVALLAAMLVVGLWRLWRARRLASPLPAVLSCVAVAYPATLLFRLTLNGSETSNRASAYVYLGLGYVLAAGGFSALPTRTARGQVKPQRFSKLRWPQLSPAVSVAGISLAIGLLLVGGIVVGTDRTERLPGPYYPAVTPRAAVDRESNTAARWVGRHLPPHQPLFSDIVNRLLMSSYGRENTVCCYVEDRLLPELFLTPMFSIKDEKVLELDHVALVVVDLRLAQRSPSTHLFFERADGGPYFKPLSREALTKFASVRGVDQLFDSGNIVVYSTAQIESAVSPRLARVHQTRAKTRRYKASKSGSTVFGENRAAFPRAAFPIRSRSR